MTRREGALSLDVGGAAVVAEAMPVWASRVRRALYVLVPVLAGWWVYQPITGAYFFGDDFVHLIEVVNDGLGTVAWRPYMGHLYVVQT